jgi:hypothetical protein
MKFKLYIIALSVLVASNIAMADAAPRLFEVTYQNHTNHIYSYYNNYYLPKLGFNNLGNWQNSGQLAIGESITFTGISVDQNKNHWVQFRLRNNSANKELVFEIESPGELEPNLYFVTDQMKWTNLPYIKTAYEVYTYKVTIDLQTSKSGIDVPVIDAKEVCRYLEYPERHCSRTAAIGATNQN